MDISSFKRPYTDDELVALARRVHQTARDKGWWPNTVMDQIVLKDGELEEKLVLVVTELAEAFEDYRDPERDLKTIYATGSAGSSPWAESNVAMNYATLDMPMPKPDGFPVEMADAYIRVLDLFCAGWGPSTVATAAKQYLDFIPTLHKTVGQSTVGQHFFRLLANVTSVPGNVEHQLARLLVNIEVVCHDLDVDLRPALELKATYNSTRPARHGGKRA